MTQRKAIIPLEEYDELKRENSILLKSYKYLTECEVWDYERKERQRIRISAGDENKIIENLIKEVAEYKSAFAETDEKLKKEYQKNFNLEYQLDELKSKRSRWF